RALRRVDPGVDRDVVRALQHHRAVARPRLLSVHVGHLLSEPDRHHDRDRQLLVLLPPVPRLHQVDAVALDRRGQGDDSAAGPGQSPWPLRPSSAWWCSDGFRACGRAPPTIRGSPTTASAWRSTAPPNAPPRSTSSYARRAPKKSNHDEPTLMKYVFILMLLVVGAAAGAWG